MRLGNKLYTADFETTTEAFYKEYGYTRVWCSCAVDIETCQRVHIGYDIADFFKWLKSVDKASIWFHNLKFDGEFIVSYLLTHDFQQDNKCLIKNSYNVLIDDSGQWYLIEINIEGSHVKIYDSLKKLPFKVSEIADMLKLEEQKLSIDYDLFRPEGYIPTDKELKYIDNDCIIVARALKSLFERGLKSMTLSGDAMAYYRRLLGRKYEYLYPSISIEQDNDIRLSYKGGFVYCNKQYAGQIIEGCSFDVNSLYPSVLRYKMLPFGMPIAYRGKYKQDKHYPLYIQQIQVDFKLKKGKLPTIQIKHSRFRDTDYLEESNGVVVLWLTKPDLELFLEHYDCEFIKYVKGYKFKQSNILFNEYIDYWYNEKNEGKRLKDPTRTLHAKLMLNSLYGRYGMATQRINKMPYLEEDVTHYSITPPVFVAPQYTAVAAFTTAYARQITITASQLCYDTGIYCYSDTDSVHIKGYEAPEGMDIDSYRLGAWKNEGKYKGKFLRTKTYIKLKTDDKGNPYVDITCAGMPANIKEEIKKYPKPFEAFETGKVYGGKLVPKRVKGGVILVNSEFTIKAE